LNCHNIPTSDQSQIPEERHIRDERPTIWWHHGVYVEFDQLRTTETTAELNRLCRSLSAGAVEVCYSPPYRKLL